MRPSCLSLLCACLFAMVTADLKAQTRGSEGGDRMSIDTASDTSLRVVSTTDTVEVDQLLQEWHRLHPEISVDYIHLNSLEVFESVVNCGRTGECPDIAWSSAMDLQIKLVNDGFAQAYPSTEFASIPGWAIWRNEAYGITAEPIAVVYNKNLVPAEDVPHTHADLARLLVDRREFYKGKVASYDPELSGTGFLFLTNDLQITANTWALIRAFGQVGIKLYTYGHTILDRIASGEHLLAYNMIASYALARAKDDPSIGVVLLSDYTLLMTRVALIPKQAKHLAAARMFLDFLLSVEGQRQMALRSFGTVRQDMVNATSGPADAATLRPIHLGPDLLTYLDQAKRKSFFKEWRRALEAR